MGKNWDSRIRTRLLPGESNTPELYISDHIRLPDGNEIVVASVLQGEPMNLKPGVFVLTRETPQSYDIHDPVLGVIIDTVVDILSEPDVWKNALRVPTADRTGFFSIGLYGATEEGITVLEVRPTPPGFFRGDGCN